jgi:hypothetical protein
MSAHEYQFCGIFDVFGVAKCPACRDAIGENHANLRRKAAQLLGKLGGPSKSTAKQRASKKNGRKGGRPKKTVDKAAR